MQVDTIGTRKYLGNDRTIVPIYRESVLHVGLLQIEAECRRWDNIWKRRIRYEESIYVVVIKKTVTLRVKHR